jgi:hypothetical protein
MDRKKEQTNKSDGNKFTEEGLRNIIGFFHTLKTVHDRLMREGWGYKDGKLIPPDKAKPVSNDIPPLSESDIDRSK